MLAKWGKIHKMKIDKLYNPILKKVYQYNWGCSKKRVKSEVGGQGTESQGTDSHILVTHKAIMMGFFQNLKKSDLNDIIY